jgi:rhodanese-related sulfurtransferase
MSPAACWSSAPIPIRPISDKTLARDKVVILYCASGGRSALAGKLLQDMGYSHVYNVGGFKDWVDAGGETEQG